MNRKQKIIVSITGIFIVLLALVGLTYAYFLTRITGNEKDKSISVTTANLSVTYNDDMDGDGEPDPLMVFEKIMPSNTTTYTKTFKVENTGNSTASYSVVIDNMVNDFDRNQDLQYILTREGTTGNVAEGNLVVGTRQILMPKVEIEDEEVHTYTLTLKYIEAGVDQSIDMGKELSFRVNIDETTVTWDTATEGTLLYALKNNRPNGTETTIPGQEASTENEARILTTEDDYGTSYVYRGNVQNNYVTFSNMCWRIVRIQGDGTIKIVLADQNHPCGTSNGYSLTNNNSAYIYCDNCFMVGFFDTSDYPRELDWFLKGIRGRDPEDYWQLLLPDPNYVVDTSRLAESEYCIDKSVSNLKYYDEYGKEVDGTNTETTYYVETHYGAYQRLANPEISSPNLKCNMKGLDNTKAERYKSNIGLLTADEVAFAGSTHWDGPGRYPIETWDYNYLKTNANDNLYWLMTPAFNDSHFRVDYGASLSSYEGDGSETRPVIVLKSNVTLKTGLDYTQDGTVDKPYVIE